MKMVDFILTLPAFRENALTERLTEWAGSLLGPALRSASDAVLDEVSTDNLDDRLDAMLLAWPQYMRELPALFQTDGFTELAYDPEIRLETREAFVKAKYGLLAAIVIARALEAEKPIALPVATLLAQSVTIGLRVVGDWILAIVPAYLAHGFEGVEKQLARRWPASESYLSYLEGFFPRRGR